MLSCLLAAVANGQVAHFPGPQLGTRSPNGKYVIKNVDSDGAEPAHVLFLIDTKGGSKVRLRSYDRHVDILWSPLSKAFVINDYEGSDSARAFLYSLPWVGGSVDLLKKLTVYLRGRHKENIILKNDHVYLSVRRWVNSEEVLCRLEAYGEASPGGAGFTAYYTYNINHGFQVLKSRLPVN